MRAFTLLALLALTPSLAHAQTSTAQDIDEIRKNARIHVGPFYLTPTLQLKQLGVDSNVFNEAGDQKSDFMFNLSPGLDLWVPVARRALLAVSGGTDLVWYREYDSERSVDPRVTARGELYLNRLTLFAEDAYLNTRQRLNHEIDLRSRSISNTVRAGAGYRITPKFSLEVSGNRGFVEYDADDVFNGTRLQETLNRDTTGVTLAARHRLTPLTTVAVRAERFEDEFEFLPGRNSTSVRVMPGIEFRPRAIINGTAYVGFRRFTPDDPAEMPEYSGLVADLGLSHTILGATTIGVSYSRDVNYSFERFQPYYVTNSVGASVRRALGRRFDVIVSADRHVYSYRDIPFGDPMLQTSVFVEPRIDTTWNYAGSLGFRPNRTTRVGFGVSYWQRESTTARFRDYDRLRIGTTVTYGF